MATTKYPRWIPNPKGGAEILVKDEGQHLLVNRTDYESFLNEKPVTPLTIQEAVDEARADEQAKTANAVAVAVAAERERCASVAVGFGGKQAVNIANRIRGLEVVEETPSA